MLLNDFAEENNTTSKNLLVMKSMGYLPKRIFLSGKGYNNSFVDETFFYKRKDFQKRIINQNHENYYFLSKTMDDRAISLLMTEFSDRSKDTWYMFLNRDLFMLPSETMTSYKLNKRHWEFNRITTRVIKHLFKRMNKRYIHPSKIKDIDLKKIWYRE